MLRSLRAFSEGWRFHIHGVRFGFGHLSFLGLSLVPFLITLSLYGVAFYVFTLYADHLLGMIWRPETVESSKYLGWLYWAYTHAVKFFLYAIVLAVMFYTFILISNIIGSPIYDHISAKYERHFQQKTPSEGGAPLSKGILTVIKEEAKKALLMLVVPVPFLFIPVVGAVIGFMFAATFIAWDYVDFSLARDCPLLKDRIRVLWRFKSVLFGFGCPLLVPFLGLMIMPFAILGGTKLYFEKIKAAPTLGSASAPADFNGTDGKQIS